MLPYVNIGNRAIPLYGVCMAVGILISCYIAYIRCKKMGGDGNSLLIIGACGVGLGLFGAKLLYILVSYGFGNAMRELISGDMTALVTGGQVFYGGLICGVLGALLGFRLAKADPALYCDIIVPCIPLGHAFGRLGCFLGGCCYGMRYDGIFSMTFPAVGVYEPVFPVQLLEMILNLGIFAYLLYFSGKAHRKYHVLYRYLGIYGITRFMLEFLRGDLVRGISAGLSTSQWISLGLLATSIALSCMNRKTNPSGN